MKEDIDKLLRGNLSGAALDRLQEKLNREDPALLDWLGEQWEASGDDTDLPLPESVQKRIRQELHEKASNRPTVVRILYQRWAAAAAIILFLTVGGILLWDGVGRPSKMVTIVQDAPQPEQITLEDGTLVWLSNGSQLQYTSPFLGDSRTVRLSGEAYFDVAHDPERPFTIQTGSVETWVLGTSFNLKAIPGDSIVELALITGRVEMRFAESPDTALLVEPGESVVIRPATREVLKQVFSGDRVYIWREGILDFYRSPVEEVASRLSRWYGISIRIEEKEKIIGTLVHRYDTRKLSLDQVAEGISTVMDYQMVNTGDKTWVIRPKTE